MSLIARIQRMITLRCAYPAMENWRKMARDKFIVSDASRLSMPDRNCLKINFSLRKVCHEWFHSCDNGLTILLQRGHSRIESMQKLRIVRKEKMTITNIYFNLKKIQSYRNKNFMFIQYLKYFYKFRPYYELKINANLH